MSSITVTGDLPDRTSYSGVPIRKVFLEAYYSGLAMEIHVHRCSRTRPPDSYDDQNCCLTLHYISSFIFFCGLSNHQTYKLTSPYLFLQTFIPYCWIPSIHCPLSTIQEQGPSYLSTKPLSTPDLDPSRNQQTNLSSTQLPIRKPTSNPSPTHIPQSTIPQSTQLPQS